MSFDVKYHEHVIRNNIPKISHEMRNRIKDAIEKKLMAHPEIFGKPLRRSLKNYWKLRVGEWRIIYRIEKETVKIFIIDHRSAVYEKVPRRIFT